MRYTIEEIRQMPEGQTFDCKSIHIEPKALANTIVAMANADGGMIAVGISDKTRRIEVFWRAGDKLRKLPFEERLQLMYDKGERYYEDSPAYDATIEDIDMDAVKAYMKRIGYGKSPMEYLQENKGFLTYKGDVPQVSTACILLFGKRPQNFFPRARVRFIKYYGTEEKVGREMNVIKDVTFEGRILDQIQKTIDYLETQVKEHSYLGENGLFKTDREYPKFVIQEMTVNSVCHRDYSIKGTEIQIKMFDDRLVFETPGKLPGIVRTDNIRHTHFSRNPKIAEYLKAYDYVKEFGEGVDRMCRELSAIGTKEPQYHLVAFIMKASVWATVSEEGQENILSDQKAIRKRPKRKRDYPKTTQKQTMDTTPIQEEIIEILLQNPYAGRKEISSHLGSLSEDGVKYNLKTLQQKGIIKRIGPNKGGYWKVLLDETRD